MATSIATPGAAAETALAGVFAATFANAVVTLTSGAASGAQMPAVFSQPVAEGPGGLRMAGREPVALVPTASLVADVQHGSTLQVLYRGSTTSWRVLRRTDTPEAGDTALELEQPA